MRKLRRFWTEAFEAMGARRVTVTRQIELGE